jgi:hypothetical protein
MQKMMMMMKMMMMVFAAFADQDVILKSLNISSNHLPKRAPNLLHKLMVSAHLLSPLLLLRDCRGHHCMASDEPQATDSDQGLSPSVCLYGDILEIQTVRIVSTFCNSVEIIPRL